MSKFDLTRMLDAADEETAEELTECEKNVARIGGRIIRKVRTVVTSVREDDDQDLEVQLHHAKTIEQQLMQLEAAANGTPAVPTVDDKLANEVADLRKENSDLKTKVGRLEKELKEAKDAKPEPPKPTSPPKPAEPVKAAKSAPPTPTKTKTDPAPAEPVKATEKTDAPVRPTPTPKPAKTDPVRTESEVEKVGFLDRFFPKK